MHEFLSIYLPLLLVIACILTITASIVIDSYNEGELQADWQWLKQYLRFQTRAAKTWLHDH